MNETVTEEHVELIQENTHLREEVWKLKRDKQRAYAMVDILRKECRCLEDNCALLASQYSQVCYDLKIERTTNELLRGEND